MSSAETCPFRPVPLLSSEFVRDPYPLLAAARQSCPVFFAEDFNLWVVSRYEDAKAVLADPSTFSNANAQRPAQPIDAAAQSVFADGDFRPGVSLTATDPPDHARLRRLLLRGLGLTPRRLAALRQNIAAAANALIDDFADRGEADLVAELTSRLPAKVIFDLIGFPEKDHGRLLAWCADRLRISWGHASAAEQVDSAHGMVAYWRYCVDHVEAARASPPDNVTGALIRLHLADPQALSLHDIEGFLFGLIFAGQETTANLISGTLLLLAERPETLRAIGEAPENLDAIVEEGLRMVTPIMAWRRITTRPVRLGGVDLPAGAELLVHLGSANRDPAVFADGESFDPARRADGHLAFGHGIHFCMGAPLARLEAEVVLQAVSQRLPGLRLKDGFQPDYVPNIAFRCLTALPVTWDRSIS